MMTRTTISHNAKTVKSGVRLTDRPVSTVMTRRLARQTRRQNRAVL